MKRRIMEEMIKWTVLGMAVPAMVFGAAEVSARGAKKEIPEEYIQYCQEAGAEYQICPELLEAVIEQESGGDPDAVGRAGEIGLMQVYPQYHLDRMERLHGK